MRRGSTEIKRACIIKSCRKTFVATKTKKEKYFSCAHVPDKIYEKKGILLKFRKKAIPGDMTPDR